MIGSHFPGIASIVAVLLSDTETNTVTLKWSARNAAPLWYEQYGLRSEIR